jgi:hypothetical protein
VDVILWAILAVGVAAAAAFAAWEIYAEFVAKNRGAHTLSNRIFLAYQRRPWLRYVIASFLLAGVPFLALLFAHLVLQLI